MRIWWVRSTIAISLGVFLNLLPPGAVLAGGGMERLAARASAFAGAALPPFEALRAACGGDMLCAARRLAKRLGPRARLERVRHPDTDSIRRVSSAPSLAGWKMLPGRGLRLDLVRFGRKAVPEIEAALSAARARTGQDVGALEIDLRRNRGGNLDKMLRAASLFLGNVPEAIWLSRAQKVKTLPVPPNARRLSVAKITVLIGSKTASSAEIFTALLRVHAKARVVGTRSFGKNYLLRAIPVNHDWRLLVPAETVSVPGTGISGGIVPDSGLNAG